MRNYVQNGVNLTLPAPSAFTSGAVVIVGNLVGIAAETVAAGDPLDIVTRGVFTLPKVAAVAIAIGDKVYWDTGAQLVTKTVGTNAVLGTAVSNAANPSATVDVKISGTVG